MTSHAFLLGVAGLIAGGGVCSAALASYLLGDAEASSAAPRRVAAAAGCLAVVGAVVAFRASG